jgi:hypothetical protein
MATGKTAARKPRKRTTSKSSNGAAPKAKSASRPKSATSRSASASSRSSAKNSRSKASRSGAAEQNGGATAVVAKRANQVVGAVKQNASKAKNGASKAKGPAVAVGATAVGVAGGLAAGSRLGGKRRGSRGLFSPRRRVLGVPVGPKSGALKTAELLRDGAKQLSTATSQMSSAANDVHEIREQLGKANRQSPLEVVLDGLTHRRGSHKKED